MRLTFSFSLIALLGGTFALGLASAAAAEPPATASADPALEQEIAHLEHEWAHISYQIPDSDDRFDQLGALATEAAAVAQRYPNRAEPLIWNGIITSEQAAEASVFTALDYAEDAKDLFERALQVDANALHGASQMSLGTLYYRVPGSPIGFGDNEKARAYLEQAMAMDPDGLDANYFYGDFLMEQDEYAKAQSVLSHALQAPIDPNRPVWEAGRRGEVQALLDKANREVASAR